MATGFIIGGVDIDTLYTAGSGGAATGFIKGSADLNTLLLPYATGTKVAASGFISGATNLSDRFQNIAVPIITNHTVVITVVAGSAVCSYTPPGQTTCNATETLRATPSNGVGPFTYSWSEVADTSNKYSIHSGQTSQDCQVRSTAGDGVYGATYRCTVTDTGNSNYQTTTDYVLSHEHTAI